MDDITHVLAGVLIVLFFYHNEKKLLRPLLFCAVVASLFPDIDIIYRFWGQGMYLVEHRGLTHSLLGLVIFPPLLAYLFSLKWKNSIARASRSDVELGSKYHDDGKSSTFKQFYDVCFLGIFAHILMDLPTSWGTMLLWPSHHRYTLDLMFIVDPYLFVLLVVGVLGYFILKKPVVLRIALLAVLLHYGFLAFSHHEAINVAQSHISADEYAALPRFGNPLVWNIVTTNSTHYVMSDVDLLEKNFTESKLFFRPSSDLMDEQRAMVSDLDYFLRFSRFPYYTLEDGHYLWKDLRFQGRDFLVVDVHDSTGGFR